MRFRISQQFKTTLRLAACFAAAWGLGVATAWAQTVPVDVTDYLPDYKLGHAVDAFYNGILLTLMLWVVVAVWMRAVRRGQHVKELQQQAVELRAAAKKREEALQHILRLHFENTPLVVLELDSAGRFQQWTGRAEAVFGWRQMEVIGQPFDSLPWVEKDGIAALRASFVAEAKTGCIVTLRHLTRNGETRLIEWHVTAIEGADGQRGSVLALGLDVTERQEAAAALRRERERHARTAEAGSAGLWSVNLAEGNLVWDEQLAELLGYKPVDFPKRLEHWLELLHADDRPGIEKALGVCAQELEARQIIEARLRHRDSLYRWFRLDFSRQPPENGAGAHIGGTITEITRLKHAEEKYRGLVEQSLAGIFVVKENRVVYANPRFWNIFRAGGSRPPQKPEFLELVHPEDRAMVAERMRPLYAGKAREAALLFRIAGPQGHSVAIQGHGLVTEHEGEPAILGLMMDVSHRFVQEQTARRLTQVVEQSPVGIMITDPNGVIEYVNRKFCEASGYGQEELLGQSPDLFKSSKMPEEFYTDLWARLRSGKKWEGEHAARAKSGHNLTVRAIMFPIFDEAGSITNYVEIMEDITGQRNLEERLARAQRLESIGNLAGGMAHDLNNILAPVRLGAEFLKTLPFEGKEREIVEVMDISIHRATELVQQVLTFSRGRRGKREPMLLPKIIGELEPLLRETFPRDVRLEVRIAPDLAPVKADATQILQVLMNLCVNSRDAMPAGGVITVAADNVVLSSAQTNTFPGAQPGPHVRIRVSDMGTGIPPEMRSKIFEPFFTTKDVGKGTGLGLSTALGIVQEHGGIIELESTGAQGTTFVLYLPVTQETLPTPPIVPQPPPAITGRAGGRSASAPQGRGQTVLVVDDEAPLRQAVAFILSQSGYRVLEAADGLQAIELVRQRGGEVDVVLLDVMMPRLDGVATIKALRELRPDLRAIASSGVHQDSRIEALRRHGVTQFLLKPYRNNELLEALRVCLEGEIKGKP